ncbi:MAG: bifunctional precorrin-2 dehydrogenase/sirohydrochlorin ferrochelatase [Chitinophagales bacterium]|nr:bifunctional precorrin-2 dehydrogenase/sirohydrochlorin ferrochelatase [Chitinophagales bacterium]
MSNKLYPVFLKMNQLQLLVVGGGAVAAEKLGFLYKSSPNANVTVVAEELSNEVKQLCMQFNAVIYERAFVAEDVNGFDVIIAATNDKELNRLVWQTAKTQHILINVADTPELCDFYLGGIVTKGDLKIAVSTNGKSPTLAKRIREFLEDVLPDETDALLQNLHEYRSRLKTDFHNKVKKLNELTSSLIKQ